MSTAQKELAIVGQDTVVAQPPNGIGKIYGIIPQMMAEIGPIGKSQRNEQQKFNYRSVDAVYNAVHPLLSKYKVFPCSTVLDEQREERTTKAGGALIYSRLKMRYTFFAEDGSSISTEVVGEGMDSGDKASNKAMSAAYKYALFQLLCIPLVAVEPDEYQNPEIVPNAPQAAPRNDRMTRETVNDFFRRWKAYVNPEGQPHDFTIWLQETTARHGVDFTKPANWTPEMRKAVEDTLAKVEPPE